MARKILLADDSVTAQNMGRKILSDAGYDVVTVNNGSAALKRVTEQKPDLIVLDVYMPGYSGLEVCQRLKDSPDTEGIPILLTVGKLEPFKPEEARRVRAEAYIVKPFEASELLSALTRLEDQIVPSHSKGNSKSEGHGDSETGWKNRLRFPSRKKKEEPEPEPASEFVVKSADARAGKINSTPAAIPEIPRDITPEELDALSALAAKLDGETLQTAEPAEKVAGESEAPSPTASTDSKAEAAPAESASAPTETKTFEVLPVQVETLAQNEPAPIDRGDEPMFAVAANESPEARDVKPEAAVVEQTASAAAPAEVQAKAEGTEAPEAATAEKANAPVAESAKTESEVPATAAAAVPAQEQEVPAPSAEELAEALRLLTPSTADASSENKEAVAAPHIPAQEAVNASASTRWTAVAVAINPEEAGRSLETEMFQTLARPGDSSVASGSESSALNSSAKTEAQPAEDEPAAVTFADAMLRNDEPARNAEEAIKTAAEISVPEAGDETNSTITAAGGGEAMGNEQAKSGKSNWHQIRTAAPAAKDAVEAAKQADAEEPPKAMAAAADGSRLAPTDPTAIANIVDSVLADLRPKIVEEISKKLAGK